MTTKQVARLQALRQEADMHGDDATVALVDAALAGDAAAAARLGIAARAVKAVSTGARSRAPGRQSGWSSVSNPPHPWAHDEE